MNRQKRERKPAATPNPGSGRKNVSLMLHDDEVRGLRKIMAWMLSDPAEKKTKIGHQSAVRYAIAHTLAHPPEHAKG